MAGSDKARGSHIPAQGSKTALTILTLSALAAIFSSVGSNATIALGLSFAILQSIAFLLVERARIDAQYGRSANGGTVIYSANGYLSQPSKPASSGADSLWLVIRDVAFAAALCTTIATLTLESLSFGGISHMGVIGTILGQKWLVGQGILSAVFGICMVGVHAVMDGTLLLMVSLKSHFPTITKVLEWVGNACPVARSYSIPSGYSRAGPCRR